MKFKNAKSLFFVIAMSLVFTGFIPSLQVLNSSNAQDLVTCFDYLNAKDTNQDEDAQINHTQCAFCLSHALDLGSTSFEATWVIFDHKHRKAPAVQKSDAFVRFVYLDDVRSRAPPQFS